jgi:deoxyribose-phosphate aldolase
MSLAKYIDYTILRQDTLEKEVKKLCADAVKYNFAAVCIPPYYVKHCVKYLDKKDVKIATVVGFPFGYNTIIGKAEETKRLLESGAQEIDMVMNLAAFKSGNFAHVRNDINNIADLCRLASQKLKVIIETGILSEDEIKKACEICAKEDVQFVKTSTGFNNIPGASVENVRLMRASLPPHIKIKASGGIKSKAFALELIEAGADRIGTSSALEMINEEQNTLIQ